MIREERPPGTTGPACFCPRIVRRPYAAPALKLARHDNGEEWDFQALRADGTVIYYHRDDCAAAPKSDQVMA